MPKQLAVGLDLRNAKNHTALIVLEINWENKTFTLRSEEYIGDADKYYQWLEERGGG